MDTTIAKMTERMIAFSDGNHHDIDHFLRVWAYARTIGISEGLDPQTQLVLEAAALVHDIACPLCREKYGNTNGRHQEREGEPMAREFLSGSGLSDAQIDRVAFLVGRHHTCTGVDGADHQILIEADYIANALENGYEKRQIEAFSRNLCKTAAGKRLLRALFAV